MPALQRRLDDRLGFTMCEAILCGVAARFSGECRTCAAMRGSEPFGLARSPGSSIQRFPHRVPAAVQRPQCLICLDEIAMTRPYSMALICTHYSENGAAFIAVAVDDAGVFGKIDRQ